MLDCYDLGSKVLFFYFLDCVFGFFVGSVVLVIILSLCLLDGLVDFENGFGVLNLL